MVGKGIDIKRIEHEICAAFAIPEHLITKENSYITATEVRMRMEMYYNHTILMIEKMFLEKLVYRTFTKLFNILWQQRLKLYKLKMIPSL